MVEIGKKCRIRASDYSQRAMKYWERLTPRQRGKLMDEVRDTTAGFARKSICQKYRMIMVYIDEKKVRRKRRRKKW